MIHRLLSSTRLATRALILSATAVCSLAVTNGCSSDSNPSGDGGSGVTGTGGSTSTGGSTTSTGGTTGSGGTTSTGGTTTGTGGAGGTCSAPGGAVTGAANTHCAESDGGMITQAVGACQTDAGDAGAFVPSDAGVLGGDYGDTNYGSEAYDDDCKYDVSWTSTPICENANITFTVTAKYLAHTDPDAPTQVAAGGALTGAAPYIEAFKIEADKSVHLAPPTAQTPTESAGGKYAVGPLQFDESGQWIIRYHFNEECADDPEDSPHGHAAFYLNVP